jgi:large subunit ribosomal protein L22
MSFSIRARASYIRMSPRKVRLVIDLVRGKPVGEALAILRLSTKSAGHPVSKVIRSAVANAQENYGLQEDELFVSEIAADGGPIAKRGRFAARGRWKPIKKRSCHIHVALREVAPVDLEAAPAASAEEE